MSALAKILLLDDDRRILAEVSDFLRSEGFEPYVTTTVEEATAALVNEPDFAIVDLFLLGYRGAELSNFFIRDQLIPEGIPYARLTSAPDMVPAEFRGHWVLHKALFRENPNTLLELLVEALRSK